MVMYSDALIASSKRLAYPGIGVRMLRDEGLGEFAVAALTSLVFATSCSANLFSGQALSTVAFTWLDTFAFGSCMYLTLRTTAFLVGAMCCTVSPIHHDPGHRRNRRNQRRRDRQLLARRGRSPHVPAARARHRAARLCPGQRYPVRGLDTPVLVEAAPGRTVGAHSAVRLVLRRP